MEELEKTARELILAITEKTLKSLKDKGLLKEPSKLQMLSSSPEMKSLIKKLSAPKYAPCRRFRKGDEVEYLPKDGRELFEAKRLLAQRLTVVENEHEEYNRVAVKAQNGDVLSVPFYYLKLVTPVEELSPYYLDEWESGWTVNKKLPNGDFRITCSYEHYHPNAKEAAEAECARLNAEYRKEQNNG